DVRRFASVREEPSHLERGFELRGADVALVEHVLDDLDEDRGLVGADLRGSVLGAEQDRLDAARRARVELGDRDRALKQLVAEELAVAAALPRDGLHRRAAHRRERVVAIGRIAVERLAKDPVDRRGQMAKRKTHPRPLDLDERRRKLDPLVAEPADREADEARLVACAAAEYDAGPFRPRAAKRLERRRRYRQQPSVGAAVRARSGGRFRQLEVIVFINIIGQGAPPPGVYSACRERETGATLYRGRN